MRLPQEGRLSKSPPRSVGAQAKADQPLLGRALADQDGTGSVAKERVRLDVVRIQDTRVAVTANDQRRVADARSDVSCSGDESVHEASTSRLDLDGGTGQFQSFLYETRCRGKRHIGSEGGQHDQIDVGGADVGVGEATDGRLVTEVTGGLVGVSVTTFENARSPNDPVGVEAESVEELLVIDDGVGNVAAGSQDPDPHQLATLGTRTFHFAHEPITPYWNRSR